MPWQLESKMSCLASILAVSWWSCSAKTYYLVHRRHVQQRCTIASSSMTLSLARESMSSQLLFLAYQQSLSSSWLSMCVYVYAKPTAQAAVKYPPCIGVRNLCACAIAWDYHSLGICAPTTLHVDRPTAQTDDTFLLGATLSDFTSQEETNNRPQSRILALTAPTCAVTWQPSIHSSTLRTRTLVSAVYRGGWHLRQ